MRHSIGGLAASVAFVIIMMMGGAVAQTEGPGRALIPSNVLRLSADTLRSGTFGVVKQFIVPHPGIVRLRYQFRSDGNGPQTVSVTVTTAIEGTNDGACSASTTLTTFQQKVCDIKVVAGDRVRIFATGVDNIEPPGSSKIFIRNVRLFWNVVDATSTGSVLID
jgi:hypothetical protein